jgi:Tol biopolymer transport system component
MNYVSRIGLSAIAAVSLVATTLAAAGALSRPLGAPAASSGRAATGVTVSDLRQPTVRNGEWIAYATAGSGDDRRYYGGSGSDVFITRPGDRPKLVAGRGSRGKIWNVCPAFSPNGMMLAYGRRAPSGVTLSVVGVASDGRTGPPRTTLAVPDINRRAPCPKWSADSSRLAYLDTRHKPVVRGLDGSSQPRRAGDPRVRDFNRSDSPAVGPGRDLVARRVTLDAGAARCGIAVSRPNGSNRRVISDRPCSYAIAGWSPDGRKLLVMRDVNGGFALRAISVNAPFISTTVVAYVGVNNARSWPRFGDVSWQPIPLSQKEER